MSKDLSSRPGALLRPFGISLVGEVPWGTHLCQFYESKQDLIDILVPYFAKGLRNNEFCMWVTSPPLEVEEAKQALAHAMPNLDDCLRKRQLEIISYSDWYLKGGKFDSNRVLNGWVEKEKDALQKGFEGLRLTGNTFWIERSLWQSFVDYEEAVNNVIGKHKMLALCTYCLKNCSGADVLDVVRNHVGTLVKQMGRWYLVEDAARRKAVNGAMRLVENRYSALFENMQDAFAYHKLLVDEAGRPVDYVFLEVNPAFERMTGLKREEIVGKRVTEALPGIEKDPADWIGVYGKVALTGEKIRFQNYAEPLQRWYQVSAYSPEKGYFVATFEDNTDRKRAEEALKEREEKYRGLYKAVSGGVVVQNLDGQIIEANNTACEMLGLTRDETDGRTSVGPRWQAIHEDGSPFSGETQPAIVTLKTGAPVRNVVMGVFNPIQSEYRWLVINSEPMLNAERTLSAVATTFVDISEVKKTEEALRQRTEELEQTQAKLEEKSAEVEEYANQMEQLAGERLEKLKDSERLAAIGATAGMVGHDIRNPLQAIIGDIYLAKSDLEPLSESEGKKNALESLDEIEKNVSYINKIVQDLQDFVRPFNPVVREVDFEELCEEILTRYGVPENVAASCEVDEKSKRIISDPDLLRRIVSNLVTNAIQAMPNGGRLDFYACEDSGDTLISVKDTGIGIPEEARDKLFIPLFTTKSKGQGFGLAVVKRITEALGGTITFESKVGRGTKFIIRLPRAG